MMSTRKSRRAPNSFLHIKHNTILANKSMQIRNYTESRIRTNGTHQDKKIGSFQGWIRQMVHLVPYHLFCTEFSSDFLTDVFFPQSHQENTRTKSPILFPPPLFIYLLNLFDAHLISNNSERLTA